MHTDRAPVPVRVLPPVRAGLEPEPGYGHRGWRPSLPPVAVPVRLVLLALAGGLGLAGYAWRRKRTARTGARLTTG